MIAILIIKGKALNKLNIKKTKKSFPLLNYKIKKIHLK
jgi:hypothetical protein